MSQTKYIRAKLPPVEANAILLVRQDKESAPLLYIAGEIRIINTRPQAYEPIWKPINEYGMLRPNTWVKENGKSVYWSLLRYE